MSRHIRKQVGGFNDYDVENTFFLQKQNVFERLDVYPKRISWKLWRIWIAKIGYGRQQNFLLNKLWNLFPQYYN